MRTRWNSLGGYTAEVYRFEHLHDKKRYQAEIDKRRAEANDKGVYMRYPEYNDYNIVIDTGCTGDSFKKDVKDYSDISDILGYTPKAMTDRELADAPMTRLNCQAQAREAQSDAFKRLGYHGPIGGGEARGLKNTFTELGMPDLVRRGFFRADKTVKRPPSKYAIRNARWQNLPMPTHRMVDTTVMMYCYVFKSPLPEVPFEKFIKLARMYRGDKGGLRLAVKGILANPEAHKEVETIDAIDLLAGLVGRD